MLLLCHSEYYHFRQAWVPLRWMSPEAVLEGDFSTKSDVWAFGVLMWEVFTHGEMPHGGQADDEVLAGKYLCLWYHPQLSPSHLACPGSRAIKPTSYSLGT